MIIKTLALGPFEVNCYLYYDPDTAQGVIIDPGDQADQIIDAIDKAGFSPQAILLTHGHGDHIAAVKEVKERFDIPLYIGAGDESLLKNPSANVSALIGSPIVAPDADHVIKDGDLVSIGPVSLKILHTPGHTSGGICLLDETANLIFTGDTLFWGSIGRTDLPGGSLPQLLDSIKRQLLSLPDGIVCYPGHGPETTIGGERTNNPFLTDGFMV